MVTESAKASGQRDESRPAPADPRRETEVQRDDRNMTELVQELRVAGLGVQVLFGFLLSLPFTVKFGRLNGFQHGLYLTSVVLAAVATTLLIGPVAYHRLVFRRGLKEGLVRFANTLAVFGLAAVAGAVLSAVLLLTDYVAGAVAGALITAALAGMIAVLWFAVPLTRRQERRLQRLLEAPGSARVQLIDYNPILGNNSLHSYSICISEYST